MLDNVGLVLIASIYLRCQNALHLQYPELVLKHMRVRRWYADQPDLLSILPDDAQRWTEHFAALSYGDPLFSLALSPLLSRHSPLRVQVVQCARHFPTRNAVG